MDACLKGGLPAAWEGRAGRPMGRAEGPAMRRWALATTGRDAMMAACMVAACCNRNLNNRRIASAGERWEYRTLQEGWDVHDFGRFWPAQTRADVSSFQVNAV
jgi:hypothetical protein